MRMKLNQDKVDQLRNNPPDTRTDFTDANLARFVLRVSPNGAASYRVKYSKDRAAKWVTVGSADVVSYTEAAQAARKLLAETELGGDPAADRKARRKAWSVADLVAAYMSSLQFLGKADRTRVEDMARINNHILHHLADVKVAKLNTPKLNQFRDNIITDERVGRRGRQMGGEGAAAKSVILLRAMIQWAIDNKQPADTGIDCIPFGKIIVAPDGERDIFFLPEDYFRIYEAMDALAEAGNLRPSLYNFFSVLAATGARPVEIYSLTWAEVDLEDARIQLKSDKGSKLAKRKGKKTKGGRTISLPPRAVEALVAQKQIAVAGDDRVFVPDRGKHISYSRDWGVIRDRAKLSADATPYAFRHSLATAGAAAGMSTHQLQGMLGHSQSRTTDRYVKQAGLREQRLHDIAAAAAMGDLSKSKVAALPTGGK